VRGLSIRYGDKVALQGVDLDVRKTRSSASSARPTPARPRSCARSTAWTSSCRHEGRRRRSVRRPRRAHDPQPLRAAFATSAWCSRCRSACRCRSTTTWPGAAPARHRNKAELDVIVERCLRRAALWDEVKDRLQNLGSLLSGGQQQRLTIARALSQDPDLLLLDEFSIAVDPVTTMRIEEVLKELRQELTIVLVTNLVQQARRLADRTAFFLGGRCVEVGRTEDLFTGGAKDQRTATTWRDDSADHGRGQHPCHG
jgi:ABC-type glutathione transport system ATPase component